MVYIGSNFECSKTLPRNAGELTDKTKIQYCAKVMRTNFDEFRRKVSKTFENGRYFEPNEFSSNFHSFFETAIVLPFAKNRVNLRKVRRNFECHFADSIEFSQLNSKRASKFRRLFRKVLKKFEDCFEISKSALDSKIVTAALLITEMQSASARGQLQLLFCPKDVLNGKILCL